MRTALNTEALVVEGSLCSSFHCPTNLHRRALPEIPSVSGRDARLWQVILCIHGPTEFSHSRYLAESCYEDWWSVFLLVVSLWAVPVSSEGRCNSAYRPPMGLGCFVRIFLSCHRSNRVRIHWLDFPTRA